jgi:ppGpp synthetase/RelA/SpoT-type nucleotidyltranferase
MTDLATEYRHKRNVYLIPAAAQLSDLLVGYLADIPRIDRITVRAKDVKSFLTKAARLADGSPKYPDPLHHIQDQIGARVVVRYTSDVPVVDAAVHKYLRPIEEREIVPESPSEFSYTGKHYILLLPTEICREGMTPPLFELQIKTLFQHAWAEANHDLGYKTTTDLTRDQRRQLAFTAAQAWGADHIFQALIDQLGRRTPVSEVHA